MIIEAHGHEVDLDPGEPRDLIARRVDQHSDFYERPLLEDAYRRAPEGDVLDVGAHVGNHTLWFAAVMRRHVVAIEPYPPSAERLRKNVDANLLGSRVTVIEAAAGAAEGSVDRFEDVDPGNTGLVHPIVAYGHDGGLVPCITIDGLASRPRRFAVMKVDVEGAALAVLQGSARLLDRDHPLLYVEAAEPIDRRRIERWLRPFGYREFARFCSTPTYGYTC